MDYESGCKLPLKDWIWLNRFGCFEDPLLLPYVSPFPPRELMENVSGLTSEKDFAAHGADIFSALTEASPKQLTAYESLLDFGCGCGRLARMFKGHPHKVFGCDIDARHVAWIDKTLGHMEVKVSSVKPPLPYKGNLFDGIISISIFTHLSEKSQDEFLAELHRVCQPGGYLFITVHGERALKRAIAEPGIRAMIAVAEEPFQRAQQQFAEGQHAFILQQGHLTTVEEKPSFWGRLKGKPVKEPFEYGITFTPEQYLRDHWGHWFNIVTHSHGAIHDFQDIVVMTPKK